MMASPSVCVLSYRPPMDLNEPRTCEGIDPWRQSAPPTPFGRHGEMIDDEIVLYIGLFLHEMIV